MDELMRDIVREIQARNDAENTFGQKELSALLGIYNRKAGSAQRAYAKKALLPYYLRVKDNDRDLWESWGVDEVTEERLMTLLRMKPRRTASGVATITVITKPWPCSGECIYCPNDIRMPKSYLSDEPACQRAERNYFDPYLQVYSRLHTLVQMGHPTDKVEVIILGGTWTDYPEPYRVWFVTQLFEALNDGDTDVARQKAEERRNAYDQAGILCERDDLAQACSPVQAAIDEQRLSYNEAFPELYGPDSPWTNVALWQEASYEELQAAQQRNESAEHRQVGLVVETRPDELTPRRAAHLRSLGCTKVQIGIQSLNAKLLQKNGRAMDPEVVTRAMAILRLFGFKIHIHFMANLYGSSPDLDAQDYEKLVTNPAFLPDEVKLYPCVLVAGTQLESLYKEGSWAPYEEDVLVGLLQQNALVTPPYTRISRMIRDISAHDIVAGNKKTNLRQMVEEPLKADSRTALQEIRAREIAGGDVDEAALKLDDVRYETAVSVEHFLQWITPEERIAGFLRLSLPNPEALALLGEGEGYPVSEEAMIREVHIYGRTARIHQQDDGVQHRGLGKQLIARACAIAQEAGFEAINVISAVGTRDYYRKQGFEDAQLYQRKALY